MYSKPYQHAAGSATTPPDDEALVLVSLHGADGPIPKELRRHLENRGDVYLGYYESGEGHPLVFVHSRFSEHAWLYHGGREWRRFRVTEGAVHQSVLTKAERAWVATCWLASNRRRDRRSKGGSRTRRMSA